MRRNKCSKKYNKCSKKVQQVVRKRTRLVVPENVRCKNQLYEFAKYCVDNPNYRFWQALRNWINVPFLVAKDNLPGCDEEDTFYWNGRFHNED